MEFFGIFLNLKNILFVDLRIICWKDFFSLSSCSGRIVVFAEGDRTDNKEELKIIDNKELKTSDKEIDEDKLSIVKVRIPELFDFTFNLFTHFSNLAYDKIKTKTYI